MHFFRGAAVCGFWGGEARWEAIETQGPQEANLLRLDTSKAKSRLGWRPVWDVKRAIKETVQWYKAFSDGGDMAGVTEGQIKTYLSEGKV